MADREQEISIIGVVEETPSAANVPANWLREWRHRRLPGGIYKYEWLFSAPTFLVTTSRPGDTRSRAAIKGHPDSETGSICNRRTPPFPSRTRNISSNVFVNCGRERME